jgi:hypothetical protein
MSIHGGVERQMNLLSFEWKKYIDEYDGTLDDTWSLKITVAVLDINIDKIQNRRYFKVTKDSFYGFGYSVYFNRNWESAEKRTFGDAGPWLLKKKEK